MDAKVVQEIITSTKGKVCISKSVKREGQGGPKGKAKKMKAENVKMEEKDRMKSEED
jgi:hypothetical protein